MNIIDSKFREPRIWSNNELKKFSKNFMVTLLMFLDGKILIK